MNETMTSIMTEAGLAGVAGLHNRAAVRIWTLPGENEHGLRSEPW